MLIMSSSVFPEFQSMVHTLCNKQGRLYDSDIRNLEDHLQNVSQSYYYGIYSCTYDWYIVYRLMMVFET